MWLLQPRQYKNTQLWIRLWFISCGLHGLFLFLLFVMYRGSSVDYYVRVGASHMHTPVVFVPLVKSIPQSTVQGSSRKVGQLSVAPVPIKKTLSKKKENTLAQKTAKKELPPTIEKEIVSKKTHTLKKQAEKKETKKEVKKTVPVEKKEIKKPEVKTVEQCKKTQKEVKEEQKKMIQQDAVTQVVVPETEQLLNVDSSDVLATIPVELTVEAVSPDTVYIGQVERDALYMESLIRQEVESKWRPPVGLSKDLVCEIQLEVDWHGKADQIQVIRASGVLLYDISARCAIKGMQFPRAMCGKKFCMSFKQ